MASVFQFLAEQYRHADKRKGGPSVDKFLAFCEDFFSEAKIDGAYMQPGKSVILKLENGPRVTLGAVANAEKLTGAPQPMGAVDINKPQRDEGFRADVKTRENPSSTYARNVK